jgi:aspartate-semialdehyde dehydrogenase
MSNRQLHVAIAGATGAVGVEMIRCLERRHFPVGKLTLLASARSAGKKMSFQGKPIEVQELTKDSFKGVDLALFSAGGGIAKTFAPAAAAAGAIVVDNSSAFRMDPDVPLVIPEINAADARTAPRGIIANPNCTTAVTLMALYPLHQAFGVTRVFASTYQAVSGTGAQAIEELAEQSRRWAAEARAWDAARLDGPPKVYPHQIAFNVLPQVDSFLDSGYTKEEMKMENEGRKIMHHPGFRASVTCVRVPVFRAHSVAISAEFEKPVTPAAARAVLAEAPGVELIDDPGASKYPLPLEMAGRDVCGVGRIRTDCALENGLAFWVVGDQLLKGAALNAVQIAELFVDTKSQAARALSRSAA